MLSLTVATLEMTVSQRKTFQFLCLATLLVLCKGTAKKMLLMEDIASVHDDSFTAPYMLVEMTRDDDADA
jgi:hypothetical protein